MDWDLPQDAACKHCCYLLCNLPEPRYPECVESFNPYDKSTFVSLSRRMPGIRFNLVFLITALHFFSTPVLLLIGRLTDTSIVSNIPNTTAPLFSQACYSTANVLLHPWIILPGSFTHIPMGWMPTQLPSLLLSLSLYFLNSLLWGFVTAFVVIYLKHRRFHKRARASYE